jgi:hypothetical protein
MAAGDGFGRDRRRDPVTLRDTTLEGQPGVSREEIVDFRGRLTPFLNAPDLFMVSSASFRNERRHTTRL